MHTVIKMLCPVKIYLYILLKNDDISFGMGEGKDPQALRSINHPSLVPRVQFLSCLSPVGEEPGKKSEPFIVKFNAFALINKMYLTCVDR